MDDYPTNSYTIVRKHYVLAVLFLLRFVFMLFIALLLIYICVKFKANIWDELIIYVFFPSIFIIFNYSFIKLILWIIEYFNYLFIIKEDQIFIINCSLLMRDDIEVIDSFKIIKVDSFSRWFLANILNYWTITIELQSREVRSFRFMPNPYRLIKKLEEQKNQVIKDRVLLKNK